jgi:hypothetical protein
VSKEAEEHPLLESITCEDSRLGTLEVGSSHLLRVRNSVVL